MNWTQGTWGEVAIGDDVLGGDGYAWLVMDGAINHFGVSGVGESLSVTMRRDGAGSRTGDVLASKPVRYIPDLQGGYVRRILSCECCLRADESEPCKLHAPASPGVKMLADALGMPVPPRLPVPVDVDDPCVCGPLQYCHRDDCHGGEPALTAVDPREQVYAELATLRAEAVEAERERALAELVNGTRPKPYVEYDDADRAAAAALKGAGFEMTVIERTLTLEGLIEHLERIHGAEFPGGWADLTRIEYRSRLADLHFELHERDQERGKPWAPRGRTPHVHPVMDRPMEDPVPRSLRSR